MANKKKKKVKLTSRIAKFFKNIAAKREKEYSKRLLTRIVNSSILMMWGTYVLAWYGKTEIAETLSKTIAASIIAVVVGYLAKSVIENISKHTDTFGKNDSVSVEEVIRKAQEQAESFDVPYVNMNRDC
ncbi:MAG: hypothetical protein IJ391_03420 [Clostridia bacterium]|nr:hypothetical protein [Clostridia bacterium]